LNPEDPYAGRILRVIGEEQPQQAVQVQTLDPINMPVVQVPSSVINEAPVDSADYNRALEYARAGYFNEAINGFRQVLQDNPNHFNAIMNLGKVYSVSGDSAKSCALYLKALKLNSSNLFALRSLANAYSEAGLHSFASEVTTQAQSSFPGQTEGFPTYKVARSAVRNSPRAFRPVVHALISEGLNQEALAVAQTGVAEQPESAEMMLLQGEVYKALGQYETSLESYRKALQMEPQNPKPYMLTGDLLVAAGQFTNAADEYHKALKAGFIDPDTMFEIVDRFESLGRTVDAKRVLGRLKGMNLNQSQIAKLEAHLGEKIDVSQEDN
jgi:tetratricopeptide (TPR) repeat protein